MYIDKFYLDKMVDMKYPQIINKYGISKQAKFDLIKKFRKELTLDDIFEIIEHRPSNDNKKMVIEIIKYAYNDLNAVFNEEKLRNLSKNFVSMREFVDFVNTISCSDVFSGTDFDKNWKWNMKFEDLLTCRSYKIYTITNE